MMRILGLPAKVFYAIKKCFTSADFTGTVTTVTVDPVPFIIYDDPIAGSFLFAESQQSVVDGHESIVIDEKNAGNKLSEKNKQRGAHAHDELAKEYGPQSTVDRPRWLVNDDLAACTSLTAHGSQLTAHSSQLTAHSSQLTAHGSQLTATSSTKPNSNDPAKAGSFSLLFRDTLQPIIFLFSVLLNQNKRPLVKRLLYQPAVIAVMLLITCLSFTNTGHAQAVIDFDFTGATTGFGCNGDGTYSSTSGNESIAGTGISIGSTINSISFSANYGKSGGFGSGTINFFLNGNAIGSFTGINSTCNSGSINSIDPSFFNADGPNTISFTSSGAGTRRVYNAAITVDFTPCTPPPPPVVPDEIDYCFEEPSSALTATGTGLLWYTTPSGGTSSTDAPVPSTDAAGTVAFYVSQTVGCESDRAEIDVTVNPLPSTKVLGFTNITCHGAKDGTITISGINGTAPYMYSIDNGLHWQSSDDDPYTFTGLDAGEQYKIRVEDSKGCESESAQ